MQKQIRLHIYTNIHIAIFFLFITSYRTKDTQRSNPKI